MKLYELELKQLLDIKFLRSNKPKFNNNFNKMLSGAFNSYENLQEINSLPSNNKFENKIDNFGFYEENSPSPENLLLNNSQFG